MDEEKKNNKKRKISIITVFLWLLLIVTMSVITIGSIYKQNAIEDTIDKVTIKLDMSEIDDEILNIYSSMFEQSVEIMAGKTNSNEYIYLKLIQKENKIYTYELESMPTEDMKLYMIFFDYYEDGKLLSSENLNGVVACYKEIKIEELQSEYLFEVRGEKIEINLRVGNQVDEKPFIVLLNQELSNISNSENVAMTTLLGAVSYENNIIKYIGIRSSQAKSIGFYYPNYGIYEGNTLLPQVEEVYFKDLEESNEYYFDLKIPKGTVINIKVEGTTEYLAYLQDLLQNVEIKFSFISLEEEQIDLGESYQIIDLIENQQIQVIFPEYLKQEDIWMFCNLDDRAVRGIYLIERNDELTSFKMLNLSGLVKPNEYNEINIVYKIYSEEDYVNRNPNTYATEQIKWIDQNTGKAEILLGNTGVNHLPAVSFYIGDEALYAQKLSDEFMLSSEYENNDRWQIIENAPNDMLEIIKIFIENVNLKYVYVKDTNTIYWKYNISGFINQGEPIYVYYKNYEVINHQKEILNSHKSSGIYTSSLPFMSSVEEMNSIAMLKSPNLGFEHLEEKNIIVDKIGIDGVYYIGLFEDDTLIKVEKLEVINGSGSVQINLENYAENKNYVIYEVDEKGNKLSNVSYPVNFANSYDIRNSQITSDKTIVSSVKSGIVNMDEEKYTATIEESEGTGEADYVDNMLSVKDIYQAKVTIGEEKEHKVTYEAEEGGKLEGETEEYVKNRETPEKVPTPVPDEGYEFDKWVIVENGEEIEVNPNEYVVTKDVTFIAKFKKIDKVVDIDTSDIQVWVYVVVAIVAVVGIVVVVLIVRKNKKK